MAFFQDPTNWIFLSFLGFIAVFIKFGLKAALDKLDGYGRQARDELQRAADLRAEAEALLQTYQQHNKDALVQAETIMKTAREQAAALRVQAEKDLKATAERREKQLEERLSRIEKAARDEVTQHIVGVAAQAAENLLRDNLKQADHDKLIDKATAGIAKSAH